ncbi:MAG: hypothetical protein QOG49_1924 [Frankiaceae bacterium]|jgi:hypothetical protein|nr:hypothetical protein [Frankiaceae bacterium]
MAGPTSLRLLPELEASLRQLTGVRAVRVVTGPDRHPIEIHVLAARDKSPKQVARDVQSLAMAEFDLEIDHRIISVVQLDDGSDEGHPAAEPATAAAPSVNRVTISAISVESAGAYAQVGITLAAAGLTATGTSRGPAGAANRPRIAARAALDAVAQLVELDAAEVEQAQVVALGGTEVAVCTLHFVTARGEQVVSGSAVVRNDASDAVVRAVLDAVNRRLPA